MIETDRVDKRGFLKRAKLNLCDLAGSEKINKEEEMGNKHFQELTTINRSLTTLGKVISALAKGGSGGSRTPAPGNYVPFRESKLTRLLQDSLGGSTRTCLVATVSPIVDCAEETISTLKFADRAKQVMVRAKINEINAADDALVQKLQKEVMHLREVLSLRRKGGRHDFQGQLIMLKEENQKLKEIASNVQEVERLKFENKLMRLELQKLQITGDIPVRSGDQERSTDITSIQKFSQKDGNARNTEELTPLPNIHAGASRLGRYPVIPDRCPLCNSFPPCDHYNTPAEETVSPIVKRSSSKRGEQSPAYVG